MNTAERKKLTNIGEYIIHMYQTEDLIRAYKMDVEELDKYVLSHLPLEDKEHLEFKLWYEELKNEMLAEDIIEKGHLIRVQKIVEEITELHHTLLEIDGEYRKTYHNSEPNISRYMSLSGGKITNPIQICLNGIYGLLLLRMNGKKIEEDTQATLDTFGDVISYLSFKYQQINTMTEN